MAIEQTMKTTVNNYRSRALTRSYSLGAGQKVFKGGLLSMLVISNPSLVGFTGGAFAVAKTWGAARERALVGEIAELAKQPGGLAELRREMRTLDVAEQERLTGKLTTRGVAVRDLGLTVKSYQELFALPRLWSLGAGREIFNKVWLGAAWGAGMLPVIAETQPLAAGLVFCSLLTGVMLGAAKLWGTVRENGQVKKLAALIATEEDKAELRRQLQEQGFSPALQARLTAKLSGKGVDL